MVSNIVEFLKERFKKFSGNFSQAIYGEIYGLIVL